MREFNKRIEFGVGLVKSPMDMTTDLNLFIDDEFVAAWHGTDLGGIFINTQAERRINILVRRVAEEAYKAGRKDLQAELLDILGVKS